MALKRDVSDEVDRLRSVVEAVTATPIRGVLGMTKAEAPTTMSDMRMIWFVLVAERSKTSGPRT